ncbi:8938_t:CDS:2 [Racocetra fulgida]|uniref:8938_t:CDS:1 n=1 Tax=Racocetra fulgida TaxID=60492 RepID=A0A9N8VXL0_9GLOM|nr:8938_t:CDS:2 [Racocetra fulgida]
MNPDIGRAFAKTIVWDEIKMLEYDSPIVSFIIDLTQPQKDFLHVISAPIFKEVIRIPEHYLKKPSQTFEELFNKFYSDRKRYRYDNFAGSLAFEFRKEADSRKPDFWVLIEVANTIQEILYEENSEQKMGIQLINDNLQFLLDYESLYEKLYKIELFLMQAHSFMETVEKIGNIDQIINRSRQGPTIQHQDKILLLRQANKKNLEAVFLQMCKEKNFGERASPAYDGNLVYSVPDLCNSSETKKFEVQIPTQDDVGRPKRFTAIFKYSCPFDLREMREYIKENNDLRCGLSNYDIDVLSKIFKDVNITTTYRGSNGLKQKHKVISITYKSADEVTQGRNRTTVTQQCQKYSTDSLTQTQLHDMVDQTATPPKERFDKITFANNHIYQHLFIHSLEVIRGVG